MPANPQTPPIAIDDAAPPDRALVVTAHPDDVDFGAAGTVASWVKAGTEVTYCIATDGDAGGSDLSVSRSEMARLRREEQRAAAAELGVNEVVFLGFPDGRLSSASELDLRREVSRAVRQFRPQRLLCQSPDRNWARIGASHPDHLLVGAAAVCAAYPDARNPFAHPELLAEGLQPHAVSELWLMAPPEPNRAVDITQFFDAKIRALRKHVTQVAHAAGIEERVRGWVSASAAAAGMPEGKLAELFQVVAMPPTS
ncbi:MAG TPA: PIG-L deacetylase family protein [Acidimicrobiales bacterium]|nr:PIG-L deacetylase family protein [Acidimicrobiales bacterium]